MLKIAVCDDENTIATRIEQLLADICKGENIPVDIDVYYSGEELETHYKDGGRYDLLYLDIEMKGEGGILAAANIRKLDEGAMIVFISSHDEYMISLFRLDVYAFIRKPIEEEEFAEIFYEAHRRIGKRNYYFIYKYMNMEHRVLCREIVYFQSEGRKVYIHTRDNGEERFNGKIADVETELAKGKIPFLRIHQSYLVNYHMIKSRTKTEVVMSNGERISISPDRQKQFKEEYGRLVGIEVEI